MHGLVLAMATGCRGWGRADPPSVAADTQSLSCRLGCRLFPNGTAHSFYEVILNGTAFLSFHVPNATWERRWPGGDAVATFAERELMKYPKTTRDLQHFLNTTCIGILRAQSAATGLWWDLEGGERHMVAW